MLPGNHSQRSTRFDRNDSRWKSSAGIVKVEPRSFTVLTPDASFVIVGFLVWAQLIDPARRRALTVAGRIGFAFLLFACGMVLVAAGCPSRSATAVSDLEVHRHAIVVDTHSDCTQRITYDGVDFAKPQADMQLDLPKMRAGGLDAQFFSIFVGPWRTKPEGYYAEALRQFDAVHADQLSIAMDARGFGPGPRSAYRPIAWTRLDLAVGSSALLILIATLVASR